LSNEYFLHQYGAQTDFKSNIPFHLSYLS